MSNEARASTSEEVHQPAVNTILAHSGKAADDLEALVAEGVPGDNTANEMLEQGVVILTRATVRLLAATGSHEDRLRNLEEEERARQAAADLLVCIPSVHSICLFTDLMNFRKTFHPRSKAQTPSPICLLSLNIFVRCRSATQSLMIYTSAS
jgi:hypothetical protein